MKRKMFVVACFCLISFIWSGCESQEQKIERLIMQLGDKVSVTNQAVEELGKIGEPAVPALVEALSEGDERIRGNAALALGEIGKSAKDGVPALIKALSDEDEVVRVTAAFALKEIGTPEALRAVEKFELRSRNEPTMRDVVSAFSILGVSMQAFDYYAPWDHWIEFKSVLYESGKQIRKKNGSGMAGDQGQNHLVIYMEREGEKVKFSYGMGRGYVGSDVFHLLGGDGGQSTGPFEKVLQEGKWIPVFLFGVNKKSIDDFSADIDQTVANYEKAVVIYCKLHKVPKRPVSFITVIDDNFEVSPQAVEVFHITKEEREVLNKAIDKSRSNFAQMVTSHTTVEYPPDGGVLLHISPFPEKGESIQQSLDSAIKAALGENRFERFHRLAQGDFEDLFYYFGKADYTVKISKPSERSTIQIESRHIGGSRLSTQQHIPEKYRYFIDLMPPELLPYYSDTSR